MTRGSAAAPPSRGTRGGGGWRHSPHLQGKAGSDSGPCCGKKQPLNSNHTLSTTELPPCQFSVHGKYYLYHKAQQEPWSSPSSRPISDTPYKQSEAQTPAQPLQHIPQGTADPAGQPGLWSLGSGHLPCPPSPERHCDPEPPFPSHLLTSCDGSQQRTLCPSPTIAPHITLCGSTTNRYLPTPTHHMLLTTPPAPTHQTHTAGVLPRQGLPISLTFLGICCSSTPMVFARTMRWVITLHQVLPCLAQECQKDLRAVTLRLPVSDE